MLSLTFHCGPGDTQCHRTPSPTGELLFRSLHPLLHFQSYRLARRKNTLEIEVYIKATLSPFSCRLHNKGPRSHNCNCSCMCLGYVNSALLTTEKEVIGQEEGLRRVRTREMECWGQVGPTCHSLLNHLKPGCHGRPTTFAGPRSWVQRRNAGENARSSDIGGGSSYFQRKWNPAGKMP